MDKISMYLIVFVVLFIAIFLFNYFFINKPYLKRLNGKKKKKKKNNELTELSYLTYKFKLDKERLPLNKLLIIIALINAFIISLTAVVVMIIDTHVILQLLIGFALLMALIYSIYEILGNYLVSKGYGKDEF